jgi:hypothetical protein
MRHTKGANRFAPFRSVLCMQTYARLIPEG